MKLAKRIELTFGIATGVVEVVAAAIFAVVDFSAREWASWIAFGFLFFLVPGSLVGLGSYLHVSRESTIGRVLLILGALLILAVAIVLLGGVYYFYGIGIATLILLPGCLTATVCLVASFFWRGTSSLIK